MKRILPVIMILCLLLCACGGSADPTTPSTQATEPPTSPTPTTEATVPATTEATVPATTEPTVPAVVYTHPLTGEALEAPMVNRLMAVSLGNSAAAQPQHGIGQADILFEILAEGSTTRFVGIFSDASQVPAIGSVRSGRMYLMDLAFGYNAVFAHMGTSVYADDFLYAYGNPHLDAMYIGAFYRSQDRIDAGYDWEHTLFISGQDLVSTADDYDYDLTVEEGTTYGMNFAEDATPDGEAADQIRIQFLPGEYSKTTTMTYNAETGMYNGYQHGLDMVDGNSGQLVQFKNVFVLHAYTEVISAEGHRDAELVGSGEGYFACGGQIVPILWQRADHDEPFTFTLEDGTPLVQGIGASYIAVVPTDGIVSYE